jgi:hypothetical protein
MSSRLKGDEGFEPLGSAPTKGSKWAVAKKTKNAISGFGMSTIVRKARNEVGPRHTTHSPSLSLSFALSKLIAYLLCAVSISSMPVALRISTARTLLCLIDGLDCTVDAACARPDKEARIAQGVINSRHAIGGRAWVELPDGDIECAKSGFGSFSTVSGRVYWMDDELAGLGQSVEDEIDTWGSEEITFSSLTDIKKLRNEKVDDETSGRSGDASKSRKSYKLQSPKKELSLDGCVAVISRNPPPARKLALAGDSSSDDDEHEDDYRVHDLTRSQWALGARCSAIIFVSAHATFLYQNLEV